MTAPHFPSTAERPPLTVVDGSYIAPDANSIEAIERDLDTTNVLVGTANTINGYKMVGEFGADVIRLADDLELVNRNWLEQVAGRVVDASEASQAVKEFFIKLMTDTDSNGLTFAERLRNFYEEVSQSHQEHIVAIVGFRKANSELSTANRARKEAEVAKDVAAVKAEEEKQKHAAAIAAYEAEKETNHTAWFAEVDMAKAINPGEMEQRFNGQQYGQADPVSEETEATLAQARADDKSAYNDLQAAHGLARAAREYLISITDDFDTFGELQTEHIQRSPDFIARADAIAEEFLGYSEQADVLVKALAEAHEAVRAITFEIAQRNVQQEINGYGIPYEAPPYPAPYGQWVLNRQHQPGDASTQLPTSHDVAPRHAEEPEQWEIG